MLCTAASLPKPAAGGLPSPHSAAIDIDSGAHATPTAERQSATAFSPLLLLLLFAAFAFTLSVFCALRPVLHGCLCSVHCLPSPLHCLSLLHCAWCASPYAVRSMLASSATTVLARVGAAAYNPLWRHMLQGACYGMQAACTLHPHTAPTACRQAVAVHAASSPY